jgi:hypothetical protein
MTLPNYFLADLPAEATLTPTLITEACQTLKRNREKYLLPRSTSSIIQLLDSLAREWLEADSTFRAHVLKEGPAQTGFSERTLANGLDSFFKQLTTENLERLIAQELGDSNRLDHFHQGALARGPQLLMNIAAGNLPNPVLLDIVLGLLIRSAQFIKCASGQSFIPRMFAHSIYEADGKLGACIEIAEWKGGNDILESAVFAEADCVSATGSDETLTAIRNKLPIKTRFLGYGTRVSFAYITHEVLAREVKALAKHAAHDIAAWDQQGCLSPHVIYVETGGKATPDLFAQRLSEELDELETHQPRAQLSPTEAAAIATRRSFYEIRAAHSPETQMWASSNSTAWTVVFENDPRFQVSCLNRFVYVKPVADLNHALQAAELFREKLSTVGLAATASQHNDLAMQLARWGATRICPIGQMQNPPLTWRHDGRPPLADLITWTNLEAHNH